MKIGKRFDFYRDDVSWIRGHYQEDGTLYIDELVVIFAERGKGLGSKLVASLPIGTKLLAKPIPEADGSIVDIDLVKFYEKFGFVLNPDRFNNPFMQKFW